MCGCVGRAWARVCNLSCFLITRRSVCSVSGKLKPLKIVSEMRKPLKTAPKIQKKFASGGGLRRRLRRAQKSQNPPWLALTVPGATIRTASRHQPDIRSISHRSKFVRVHAVTRVVFMRMYDKGVQKCAPPLVRLGAAASFRLLSAVSAALASSARFAASLPSRFALLLVMLRHIMVCIDVRSKRTHTL